MGGEEESGRNQQKTERKDICVEGDSEGSGDGSVVREFIFFGSKLSATLGAETLIERRKEIKRERRDSMTAPRYGGGESLL